MFRSGVGALHFTFHVIYFESQDREAVECPCGTFGVDGGRGEGAYRCVKVAEIGVKLFHHVGSDLIGTVDATLESESGHGVDFRVADNVLKVPLHCIYHVFGKEHVVDVAFSIRVFDYGVNIVEFMIGLSGLTEYAVAFFSECHNGECVWVRWLIIGCVFGIAFVAKAIEVNFAQVGPAVIWP